LSVTGEPSKPGDVPDAPSRPNATYSLNPNQVLIVGDNHDSEIAAGVRLGIRTVQTLRPGVPRSPAATHHIQTLHELKSLLTPKD
jgi:FMN phosphatase YigB (HAD superfamily)